MNECNHEFELDDPNDLESGVCLGCGLTERETISEYEAQMAALEQEQEDE